MGVGEEDLRGGYEKEGYEAAGQAETDCDATTREGKPGAGVGVGEEDLRGGYETEGYQAAGKGQTN